VDIVFVAIAVGLGCGGDDNNNLADSGGGGGGDAGMDAPITDGSGGDGEAGKPGDNGMVGTVGEAANGKEFFAPLDSTPDPMGNTIYFTGMTPAGAGAIFSVAAAGGASKVVASGPPLASPFGIAISMDGATLYVADPAGANANDPKMGKLGGIYSVAASGGTPKLVAGTDAYQPRALEVQGANIYFSGTDVMASKPGVFKIAAGGGAVSVVAEGAPIADPSGVTADSMGNVYVVDTVGSSTARGALLKIVGGTPSVIVDNIAVGYPAGLTLTGDEKSLLVSSKNASTMQDQVLHVDIASGTTKVLAPAAIASNWDAAGLHRAHSAPVYSWADLSAGGVGKVYRLTQ
jgi:hypothetical protein